MGNEKARRKTLLTLLPFFFEADSSSSLTRAYKEHNLPGMWVLFDRYL
jgi:hypothetical protein